MTELKLYKFIAENELEVRWEGEELLLWIDHYVLKKFCDLLDCCNAGDGGIDCQLQDGGVVVLDLAKVCKEYGIDPNNILEADDYEGD